MKEWIEILKDELYSPHYDPITVTENEAKKLIAEIEAWEMAYEKIMAEIEARNLGMM